MIRLVAGKGVGGTSVNENDQPILMLEPGVTISNLIIGSPAAKGIWCKGSCTLQNVWWESVGTHAAGFGTHPQYWANVNNKYIVQGGGARNAADKMFIQQGAGTTIFNNFYALDASKLFQSCGDCPNNNVIRKRHLIINSSTFQGPGLSIAGMNSNFGDTISYNGLQLCNSASIKYTCQGYEGNTNYDNANGVNFMQAPIEKMKVGQALNGVACNDPHAKIVIAN
uniref:Probable pectate lyase F n=1 Tax=Ditylenchus dipsaci TaxID=166011 RepID=A0A915DFD8_9BILA